MKKKKICAALLAAMMVACVCGAGCKKNDESSASASDTGISLSIDPNVTASSADTSTGASESASESASGSASGSASEGSTASGSDTSGAASTDFIKMRFEDNYDQAAINEMSKKVTVHGITYNEFDFNFYYANEYIGIMQYVMGDATLQTQAGFINLDAQISDTMTIRDYLRQTVETDLQGEAFLTAYASSKKLTLTDDIIQGIEDQIAEATKNAETYGMNINEYLQSYYGPTANTDVLRTALQRYELANLAQKTYVAEYKFADGEDMLPTVYHVLFPTIDLTTREALSAEDVATAKKNAEDLLSASKTLEELKTNGEQAKTDGKAAECAQYTVQHGQMVQPFEDWCFAKHEVGEMGIVETQFGYHVMCYVGQEKATEEQKKELALSKMQDELTAAINSGEYNIVYN
ncbi:MAG: peptidylprolyl isomerase [Clostridiales bacterium]|nr:peptidylprolyl isomerase [Clostridiales bacterium]